MPAPLINDELDPIQEKTSGCCTVTPKRQRIHPHLQVCEVSIFPTTGGVNPSLTITSIAMRMAGRIRTLAARGELWLSPPMPREGFALRAVAHGWSQLSR